MTAPLPRSTVALLNIAHAIDHMFLLIFALALGRSGRTVGGLPFLHSLAPGLIMMAVIQNAFANTSASILIGKIQGNIVDLLMPPLRPAELMFGLVAGGVTRGLVVAVVVTLAMLPVVPLGIAHPPLAGIGPFRTHQVGRGRPVAPSVVRRRVRVPRH